MSDNTVYGFCRGCDKWIPRDDMLSINVSVYSVKNEESRIPLRFCPECHAAKGEALGVLRWDNNLKTESQIRTNRELAAQSDLEFDESVDAQEAARVASERSVGKVMDFGPSQKDDSEAAMRRKGRRLDVKY